MNQQQRDWEAQARADMERLKDEDLSDEPDDWGDNDPGLGYDRFVPNYRSLPKIKYWPWGV